MKAPPQNRPTVYRVGARIFRYGIGHPLTFNLGVFKSKPDAKKTKAKWDKIYPKDPANILERKQRKGDEVK